MPGLQRREAAGEGLEARPMLDKDLNAAFPTPAEARDALTLLFTGTVAIQHIPDPTPAQIATGEKAARALLTFDRKPEGPTTRHGTRPRRNCRTPPSRRSCYVGDAREPGSREERLRHGAVSVYSKALTDNPENAFIAYSLGQAYAASGRRIPAKTDECIPRRSTNSSARMVIDPCLGGTQDGKKISDSSPRST